MSLRDKLEEYIEELESDTVVSISEGINNHRVAADLRAILEQNYM